jgi:RimJ/RimL family protein N-acetyltransferase
MGSLKECLPKRLQTTRLFLELFDHSDAHYECFFEAMNSKTAHATMGDYGIRTRSQFDSLCKATRLFSHVCQGRNIDEDIIYFARLKEKPQSLIGLVSLGQRSESAPPDIGWAVLEKFFGHGYAPEAARELLRLCQELLGIKEIMAWPGESNWGSVRTAQKVGFTDGGTILDKDGVRHSVYVLPGMQIKPKLVLSFWGDRREDGES